MPEGPEIIITTQYLNTKLKKKKIESIKILSGRYTHEKLKGFDLLKNTPITIETIDSKGKFMWMKLIDNVGNTIYMLNTFGMTGRWSFHKDRNARIKFVIKSNTNTEKKYDLYYIDTRNMGTLKFVTDKRILQKELDKLAPDVLKTVMDDDDLVREIKQYIARSKTDKNLVKVLMDQKAIVSGIGNYLVAEILYDAKLDPHRSIKSLSEYQLKNLAHSIRKIAKQSYYKNEVGYMDQFKLFMKTHVDRVDKGIFPNYHPDIKPTESFQFKVYRKKKDPHGNDVETDELVKNRKIHWVKNIQK